MAEIDAERWLRIWKHHDALYRLALRRLGDAEEARDVVAEALVRAVTSPHVDVATAGAWANTVVRNLCTDRHRARTRQAALGYSARNDTPVPSPEDEVCDRAEAVFLLSYVSALPDRQRRAVEMLAEGHDVRGIANALGAPYKAAESLLGRARRSLRAVPV